MHWTNGHWIRIKFKALVTSVPKKTIELTIKKKKIWKKTWNALVKIFCWAAKIMRFFILPRSSLYFLSLQNEKQLCGVWRSVITLVSHLSPSVGQAANDQETSIRFIRTPSLFLVWLFNATWYTCFWQPLTLSSPLKWGHSFSHGPR